MLIRIKLARLQPTDCNRLDVIQRRGEYANWFMTDGILQHYVVIVECGYIYGLLEAMGELELVKGPLDKSSASAGEM